MTKKKRKSGSTLSFGAGFVQNRNAARVIGRIDELADAGEPDCWLMKWTMENKWGHFDLEWSATRIWVFTEPEAEAFAIGPEGRVCLGSHAGPVEEVVDASDEGPKARGPLRDLRGIDGALFTCGMGRQVYQRVGKNRWVRADEGVVVPVGEVTLAGFNSIDGLSENDIYAVGFEGEIWRRQRGKWRQLESPTNVILHQVRAIKKNLTYACGQKGVLLLGDGDSWKEIHHTATEDHLWGMQWFNKRLYVSSDEAVYVLEDDEELRRIPMKGIETCGHLHANDGVMWSFGTKDLAWTEDTVMWHDETP
jgi:hypothetical protein